MTIRWGIIGCGDVCEVKSGPALQKCGDSEVVCVMRRDGDKAADFARRHGIPKWTTSAAEVIADPRVNAVYVATPVGTHLEHALRVAAAGKPCLVEKPMARSHAECARMVEAFDHTGAKLFVAYYRRSLPWFTHVKQILDSEKLGPITSVSLQFTSPSQRETASRDPWRLSAEQAGGGLFMDLASHTLDLLDFLLGPVDTVHGLAANRASATAVEDNVAMCFRFKTGVMGTASWDFAAARNVDVIQIHGTAGRLTCSTFGRRVLVEVGDQQETIEPAAPAHVHQPLAKTIVDELLGRGTCPSSGRSAARTAAVMDCVLKEYYGGRDDAFWDRPDTWPGRRRSS